MIISENECKKIKAGSITGTLISAVTKVVSSIFDIGRALGSSIRRLTSKSSCSLK